MVIIIYVWLFDLFLYSNTEIFLIFFIFLNFGVLFFFVITWYYEYLERLIFVENRNLYTLVFLLKKKFEILKTRVIVTKYASGSNLASYDNDSDTVFEFYLYFSIFRNSVICAINSLLVTIQYCKVQKYLHHMLFQIYKFEITQLRKDFSTKFANLGNYSDKFFLNSSMSSSSNPMFGYSASNFFLYESQFFSCQVDFFNFWVSNFINCNYTGYLVILS